MRLAHRLTIAFITLLICKPGSTVAQIPSPRANSEHALDPRLSLILQANAEISQDTRLQETIAWIDNLHSAPVCTQLASSKLVSDCQLLDNPTEFAKVYPDQVLEDIQNEYALKLALCEYVGAQHAHSKPPPKCHTFLPSREACVKRSWLWGRTEPHSDELCYPATTKADLTQCLSTMQSSPQTWTSYSNARSRAMHICHLSRQHIDKEEALQFYKNLTLVVSKLHEYVQPLESKIRAMEEQLHDWSDDTRRLFEDSQQAAEGFTQFAKQAQKQHEDQLQETNQSLRSMRSQVEALQEKADEHYDSLNAKFEARMEASLAKGVEAVAHNQADALAQFARNMGIVYQTMTQELAGQFERYNTELQVYHEKNMLAIQQQHETSVQSFDILRTGIDSVSSDVGVLNDKTSTLKSGLDDTITQVGTVNEGLGTLASVAHTAGQFMTSFETMFAYLGVGGVILGLIFFANCVSSVPLVGIACRKFIMAILALGICGISTYTISRSDLTKKHLEAISSGLGEVDISERSHFWLRTAVWVSLSASVSVLLYKPCLKRMVIVSSRFANHYGSYCDRAALARDLPQTEAPQTAQLSSGSTGFDDPLPPQQSKKATIGNLFLSKEAQEDEDLRDRIGTFRRATTVC